MGFFLWLVGNTVMVGFLLSRKKDLPIDSGGKWMPDGVIVEILSFLPVKSVLRFKCVCKSWKMITLDSKFIQKHMSRSESQIVYEDISKPTNGSIVETFKFINYKNGLVVEQSEKTGKYRIRNPATKQVLQVVDDPELQERWRQIYIGFVSSTNIYKLICLHGKKRTNEYGIKLLTIGTDRSWRPLDISLSRENNERSSEDIYYMVNLDIFEVEKTLLIRLNLKDESFMKIEIPQRIQTLGSHMFMWDEKPSLGFIINKKLHVWVLENHMNHIWSEKKIIPLNFIMNYPNVNKINVCRGSKGQLDVILNNDKLIYDINSKKVLYIVETPQDKKILYDLVPCLLSLKGMHFENINSCLSLLGGMCLRAAMISRTLITFVLIEVFLRGLVIVVLVRLEIHLLEFLFS